MRGPVKYARGGSSSLRLFNKKAGSSCESRPSCRSSEALLLFGRRAVPHQNSVEEIRLQHSVLPVVLVGHELAVDPRADRLARQLLDFLDRESLAQRALPGCRKLAYFDRNVIDEVHLDGSIRTAVPARCDGPVGTNRGRLPRYSFHFLRRHPLADLLGRGV